MKLDRLVLLVEAIRGSMLYHSTSMRSCVKILDCGLIEPRASNLQTVTRNYNRAKICLTRDSAHLLSDCIIEFDRYILAAHGIRCKPYSMVGNDEHDNYAIDVRDTISNPKIQDDYERIDNERYDEDNESRYTSNEMKTKEDILDHMGRRVESEERVYKPIPVRLANRIIFCDTLTQDELSKIDLDDWLEEYAGKLFYQDGNRYIALNTIADIKNYLTTK